MMYPRLALLRDFLTEDGVIFISIDDFEAHRLRAIVEEIFGAQNFIAQIIWDKTRKNDAKLFSVGHEYILVFARSLATLKERKTVWREQKPGAREIIEFWKAAKARHGQDFEAIQEELRNWYRELPRAHPSKKLSRYKWVDQYGPWRDRDISWPGGGGPRYVVPHPRTRQPCKVPEAGWRFATADEMQRQIRVGLVEFREDHTEPPFRKARLLPTPGELDTANGEGGDDTEADEVDEEEEAGLLVMPSVIQKQAQVSVKLLRRIFEGRKVFPNPSNVLHAVSALQLKREGMIKLPVELESRDNWLDVLALTVQRRAALEQRAQAWGQQCGRFIRPIALIQAQPRSKARETHTVDAIKIALVQQLKVPAERIRIATGEHDDLGTENLGDKGCKVEYVITVDKLREGWDCPFAYVLGSVGNVATETAVEQLLGRVLRMPEAVPTGTAELDRAYAVVQSPDVVKTAKSLCDSLVSRCGFDAETVGDALRVHRRVDAQCLLPVATIPVSVPPDPAQLLLAVRGKVEYDAGSGTLHVRASLTRDETVALRDSLGSLTDRAAVEQYWQTERGVGTAAKSLDQYAQPLSVPQLIVRDGGRCYLFEPEELDEFSWDLDRCDAAITDAEFTAELTVGDRVLVGVTDRGGVRIGGVEEVIVRQLSFVAEGDDWSKAELVRWMDGELHHGGAFAGLPKAQSQAWLLRVVDFLLTDRQANLPILVRKRHDLADVVIRRIAAHGRQQVRAAANLLISGRSPRQLETSMDLPLVLAEQDYSPYRQYRGMFSFAKHAFTLIGEMRDEESQCAKRIDDHLNVKRWVRNLTHESAGGFSLPLSPGRFFPDFIVELLDGRIVLVEYKGGHLAQDPKEVHKESVGKLWEARSAGQCAFVRVVDRNWPALESALQEKR